MQINNEKEWLALMNLNTYTTWFKCAKGQSIEHHADSSHLFCGEASLLKLSRKELFFAVRIMSFQGRPSGSAAICSKMTLWDHDSSLKIPTLWSCQRNRCLNCIYSSQSIVDARVQVAMTSKNHPNIEYIWIYQRDITWPAKGLPGHQICNGDSDFFSAV